MFKALCLILDDEQHSGRYWLTLFIVTLGGGVVVYLTRQLFMSIGLHDPNDPLIILEIGDYRIVQFGELYNLACSLVHFYGISMIAIGS